jgi:hypothetical protein
MGKRIFTYICLAIVFYPQCLHGSDIFGNFTYRGKVVDADTLQPIQGAVVVAKWEKCWPGIGAGGLCDFSKAKEALTDANGEWSIKGPKGIKQISLSRMILGYVIHWTEGPRFMVYKPGYYLYGKYGQGARKGFRAIPYEDKEEAMAGIALEKPATMRQELKDLDINYNNEVPFITIDDPEERLRSMDFKFTYNEDVKKVSLSKLNYPLCEYWVLGLKKTMTKNEWKEERIYPGSVTEWEEMPLLRKVVEEDFKDPVRFD